MEFKEQILEYTKEINKYLDNSLIIQNVPERRLLESMKYSLMAGGKRLRPILVIATYKLFKYDYLNVIPFAIAMELVHNFSLIHDDLPAIDNDDFRHGILTNHKRFDESTAILAGDGLLNSAYQIISESLMDKDNLDNKIIAYNEFSKAVFRMIAGEYVDIDSEGKDIPYEILEYIHQNKTGALLKASVKMGAILAGASEYDISKVTEYADKIGLSFQIKDDILSETGDEKIMGKPVGNDKKMKKCSFATIYGIEKSNEILETLTNEAIEISKTFGIQSEFFKCFALFVKNRNY
ncbi:MAG: polyprenyl synthetase family protein [Clostridia bacterium]|nr:polyprenyl synthetase family protein [Clostridia bacterium]MDD4387121.1 polyprenyl synthetase family protein [Clostridia bacterium]